MATLVSSCARDETGELSALVPQLPDAWIEALCAPDEQAFLDFAHEQGPGYQLHAEAKLGLKYDTDSTEAFHHSREVLDEPLLRLRGVLAREHGFEGKLERYREFRALDDEEALEQVRLVERAYAIDRDKERPAGERSAAIQEILQELEARNAAVPYAHLYLVVAQTCGEMGDRQEQRVWLEQTLAVGDHFASYRVSCQALGLLTSLEGQAKDLGAMLRQLERGYALAKEHHIPGQAGRFASFLGHYYEAEGRLSLARDLRREAQELCTRYGGDPNEVRYYIDWLHFQARMGCWAIVERDLEHAEMRLAKMEGWIPEDGIRRSRLAIEVIRGRLDMTFGRVEEANRRFASIESQYGPEDAAQSRLMKLSWGLGLLYNEKPLLAREVLTSALEGATRPEMIWTLRLQLARAEAELENWGACVVQLDSFATRAGESPDMLLDAWTLHDALRVRLAHSAMSGREAELSSGPPRYQMAIDALEKACRELDTRLREIDAAQEGYFALRNTEPLRRELQAIAAERPELGYALELCWRELPRVLGASKGRPDPLERCAQLGAMALRRQEVPSDSVAAWAPVSENAVHLLYRVQRTRTDRWMYREGRLTHDRLPLGEQELRERIGKILRVSGVRPDASGASLPPATAEQLQLLARELLPPSLLEAGDRTEPLRLLLSPDGPLNALPFAILNLSAEGYLPLIQRFSPVYLGTRKSPCMELPREAPGLIVSDPDLSGAAFAPGRGLPPLDLARAEAEALHEWSPQSLYLTGSRATKEEVLENLRSSAFLYFASHMVRDPEAPYLSYLPLSSPPGTTRRDEGYLDVTDVNGAELGLCPLVVLSACDSGTPYVVQGAQAPGLGDAFLDAGARAVIQTYWAVDDAATAELMRDTMGSWGRQERNAATALNDARRRMAMREDPFRHPFYWGGAVVKIQSP